MLQDGMEDLPKRMLCQIFDYCQLIQKLKLIDDIELFHLYAHTCSHMRKQYGLSVVWLPLIHLKSMIEDLPLQYKISNSPKNLS